ncbi:lantibiotic dehydratase family protein [Chryseobacterium rhizosphaerae]|nr:lantibiotic dehydratase family protein [Chryseobacterium rhizosphaerae]GEN68094.1 hypothetical protein CRH01_26620 [Chryseobacterium rhizosphaerae]
MNKNPYVCLNRFILRFPVYSSDKVLNYNHGNNFLFELFSNDSFFRNAICIASYELYRFLQIELKKEHIDNDTRLKLNISLYKYYSRMCTRSTPFGLFSGVMAGEILYKNQFQIDLATVRISQQFDNSFLYKIVKKEFELKGENILLFLNNTMKRYGNKYRYIEESVNKSSDKKTFSVSETKYNRILNQIFNLTKNGITKDTLIEKIRVSFREYEYDEIEDYIIVLIENNVLISDIEIKTYYNYFENLHQILKNNRVNTELKKRLTYYDNLKNDQLKNIEEKSNIILEDNNVKNNPFKCSLTLHNNSISLDQKTTVKLKKVISFFNKISPKMKSNIDVFVEKFFSKYEYQEIALLEALDGDIGIGFPTEEKYSIKNNFIDDIKPFTSKDYNSINIVLDKFLQIIQDKIFNAGKSNKKTIHLTDKDFPEQLLRWDDLPNTIYGFVKFFYEGKDLKIAVNGFGGSSALNLISRFYDSDEEIASIVNEIVEKEKELLEKENIDNNANCIIAEVVFNPDNHVSNVLEHPLLFDYFIPILSPSQATKNSTPILLDDIYLKIGYDRKLVLWSQKLNATIKPILTNAHNYANSKLGIYKFLSEFQNYNKRTFVGFSFGNLKRLYSFIPRFEYDNIVISEASWFIDSVEFEEVKKQINNIDELFEKVNKFQNKYQLPRYVLFVEEDNELLIDFKSQISIRVLLNMIKKSKIIEFKEFLLANSLLKNYNAENYSHEMMISFYKNGK